MIDNLRLLRKSAIVAFSTLALSSISLSAQAINLVKNGGFVPSSSIGYSLSSGINNPDSPVTITDWVVRDEDAGGASFNNLMYVISDGNTFSRYGAGMNQDGRNGRRNWTLFSNPGQTVNSVDGSGWYIASDGGNSWNGRISQTLENLKPGSQYNIKFSQAAGQFDCYLSGGTCTSGNYFGDTNNNWRVSFGDSIETASFQDSVVIAHPSQAPVSAWQSQSMNFTATSSTQVLSFLSQGTPDGQPPTVLLSGVSVEEVQAVPWETDTLPLVGSTVLFGLGLWAKQKFSKKKLK